jgi:hypothetical protein
VGGRETKLLPGSCGRDNRACIDPDNRLKKNKSREKEMEDATHDWNSSDTGNRKSQ